MPKKVRARRAKSETAKPVQNRPGVVVTPASHKHVISVNAGEAIPTVYANNAMLEASNWDVRIRLGLIQEVSSTEVHVRDVITVYMSHEHAKIFSQALSGLIAKLDEMKQQIQQPALLTTH